VQGCAAYHDSDNIMPPLIRGGLGEWKRWDEWHTGVIERRFSIIVKHAFLAETVVIPKLVVYRSK
jgi:hypothetical protein